MWEKEINISLKGYMLMIYEVSKILQKSKSSTIINFSSDLGIISPNQNIYSKDSIKPLVYSVSKHGIIGMTKYFATLFSQKGLIINKSLADKYYLPFENRKYGDLTWWANEGVLIYPDFFHKRKILTGMHGYRPDTQSTYGTCVIWHKDIAKEKIEHLELHKIYDEIIKLLN